MIPQLERLLDPDALEGLMSRPIDQLRRIRVECAQVESDVSLARRVAQGRLDIVGHEAQRRAGVADAPSASGGGELPGLLFDLPEIMSDDAGSTGTPGARPVSIGEPGAVAGALVDELDAMASPNELASVESLSDDELRQLFDRIGGFEGELSTMRRQLHERIDAIQAEIGRRYRDGEATVDSVLG